MKIAITGGNGHLGNAIILELLHRGYTVKALAHRSSKFLMAQGIEIVNGSIQDKQALETLMDDCDALIHCAAVISISGDKDGRVRATNVDALENVFSIALQKNMQRVIHVSSIHAFNHVPSDKTLDEQRSFVTDSAFEYDKSKRDGQLIAKKYFEKGLPIIVVNPTAVFGQPNYVNCKQNSAFLSMAKGRLPFVFKGGFDWVDVRDVANSICNALNQGTLGKSYILGGHYFSIKELSAVVSSVLKKKIFCFELPIWLVKLFLPFIWLFYKITGKDPSVTTESIEILQHGNKRISSQLAVVELGHRARPITESVADLLHWKNNLNQ